ncbi:MAG: FkbM family methyltransferase [Chitinophagaceae bacterium]
MLHFLIRFYRYIQVFGMIKGPALFLKMAAGRDEVQVKIDGYAQTIHLRKRTADIEVFDQIFISKGYDMSLPFSVKRIVDCGANIGLAAIFLNAKHKGSHVVMIEPEDKNFSMCLKNIDSSTAFTALKKGLWKNNCYLKITDSEDESWAFKIEETLDPREAMVEAITIDEIMARMKWDEIDILKIDIEGAEKSVFEGDIDRWLPKVKSIFIELHDNLQPGTSDLFFGVMKKYGFSFTKNRENWICIRNDV